MQTYQDITIGSLWEYMPPKTPHCPVLNRVHSVFRDNIGLESTDGKSDSEVHSGWLLDAYVLWTEPEGAKECPHCGHNHIVE